MGKKAELSLAQFAITQKLCLNPRLPYCLKDYANVGRSVIICMKCLYLVIHIPRQGKPSMEIFFLNLGFKRIFAKEFLRFFDPLTPFAADPQPSEPSADL